MSYFVWQDRSSIRARGAGQIILAHMYVTTSCRPRQVFFCLQPLPSFVLFGVVKQLCRYTESGQTQSVKLLQNIASNRTQQQHPHPLLATQCLYILNFVTGKGGGEGGELNQREG
jgi:hypothetical protein